MSFLFGGPPKMSSAEKIAAAETEIEMVSDMFNRLTESCTKKCIPIDYREGDLNKGESVCLDRCVSKFFDVNVKVSQKMQGEAAGRAGGMGGMGM
ncbi:Tim10/DDP family zinc finger protein [Aspergillus melleus]|uniref:Tim10/DDP family zinc finger protein n=1 Tax=Aspergillus melleus TaxID=138277 RepID=UPI001E8DF70D|nr:protein transporter tim10 [Aspergillus melleus]KAH8422585.1 protein transporter tim10 [Aspergillus melleus]